MSKLDIQWGQQGPITFLMVTGSLDSDTSDQFDKVMTSMIESGHRWFVVDVSGLEYLSSAGIGVLVGSANELRESSGDLRLAAVPDKIARVLNMLALLEFFSSFPDLASAAASYQG